MSDQPARATDLLAAVPAVTEAWLHRLGSPRLATPGLAGSLPAVVVTCVLAGADPGAAVAEAGYALGAVRAAQGHGAVTVVEDVLTLRPRLAAETWPADLPLLGRTLDAALLAAVAGHEAERPHVLAGTRDPLSGLLHPAVFTEVLDKEVAAAARDGAPSLLLVDLDGFAEHLEEAGRLAVDLLLVRVAQLLVESSRRSDVLARLEESRLALLLPRTDQARALVVARRVLARARTHEHLAPEVAPVALRLGLGWLPAPASGDRLVTAADQALQRARLQEGHALEVSRPEDRRGVALRSAAGPPAPLEAPPATLRSAG